MTIRLEHPEFHASVAEVRRTASWLSEARARASGEVDDLLETWRGSAAEAFAEAWTDWRAASATVASVLAGLAESLELFQLDVTTCNDQATSSLEDLSRRLS
jgi:WXG100 family type VII secretion target